MKIIPRLLLGLTAVLEELRPRFVRWLLVTEQPGTLCVHRMLDSATTLPRLTILIQRTLDRIRDMLGRTTTALPRSRPLDTPRNRTCFTSKLVTILIRLLNRLLRILRLLVRLLLRLAARPLIGLLRLLPGRPGSVTRGLLVGGL
jgi:hypothetical protein